MLIVFNYTDNPDRYTIKQALVRKELVESFGSKISGFSSEEGKTEFKEVKIIQKPSDKLLQLLGEFRDGEIIPFLQVVTPSGMIDLPISEIMSFKQ